jgi:hypothetical protein
MRTYAIGLAAVLGLAIPASADTAATRIQLAQTASDSGAQAGGSAGTAEPGNRQGSSKQGSSKRGGDTVQAPGGAAGTQTSEGRRDGEQSRTSVRANVRVDGDRRMTHSRRDGSRTTIRTRIGSDDDTVIRRKNVRRHVYSEPSTTVIKKKKKARRYVYTEPSSVIVKRKKVRRYVDGGDTAVVRHRRPGVSVGIGVSGRTSVRERTGTSVNVKGSTTTRSTTTTTSGERSSGNAGANVRTNTSGQDKAGNSSGGAMKSRSTSGSGGTGSGESSGNRQ